MMHNERFTKVFIVGYQITAKQSDKKQSDYKYY